MQPGTTSGLRATSRSGALESIRENAVARPEAPEARPEEAPDEQLALAQDVQDPIQGYVPPELPAEPPKPLTRDEMGGKLWEVARVPKHALDNVKDKDLPRLYEQIMAMAQTPGEHKIKVGKHEVKFQTGQNGELLGSTTKKKGFLSKLGGALKKVGSIALTVASVIPSPIMPFAQAGLAIKGAIQGIKNGNFLQAAAGVAGAFSAGATAFIGGAAASVANAARNAQRLLQGANTAITAAKAKNFGGLLAGAAGAVGAAAGFASNAAGGVADSLGKVATRLGQGAALINTADSIRKGNVAGALAGGLDFAGSVVGDQKTSQRLNSASSAVSRAAGGDIAGALADGMGAADIDSGSDGPSKTDLLRNALQVGSGAAGMIDALKNGGDLEEATRRMVHAGLDANEIIKAKRNADAAKAAAAEPGEPEAEADREEQVRNPAVADAVAATAPGLEPPPELPIQPLPIGREFTDLLATVPDLPPPPAAPAVPEKPKPEPASEATIKYWQRQLNAHGANLDVDGKVGPKTEAAIREFQAKQGLEPDGMIGTKTQAAMSAPPKADAPAAPAAPPRAPAQPARPAAPPAKPAGNAVQGFFDGLLKSVADGIDDGVNWAENKAQQVAHTAADQLKGTVLESAARYGAWTVDQQVQAAGGAVKAAGRLVTGVGTVVNHPLDTVKGLYTVAEHIPMSPPHLIREANAGLQAYRAGGGAREIAEAMDPLEFLAEDLDFGKQLVKGVVEPYKKSIDEGKPAEAVGGVVFDIGTILLTGGAGGAAKGATQGGVTAANVASKVARTAEAAATTAKAAATAAKAAETATTAAKAAETAAAATRTARTLGKATASVDDVAERALKNLNWETKTETSLASDLYKKVYNPVEESFKPALSKEAYGAALEKNGLAGGANAEGRLVMNDGYWIRAYGNVQKPMSDKVARLYLNMGDDAAPQVTRRIMEELDKQGVSYQIKIPNNPAKFGRKDAGVLYVDESAFKQAADVAKRVSRENPSWFREGGPAFTKPVDKGISAAAEPVGQGGKSFGQTRSELVAKALKRAADDGVKDPTAVKNLIRDEFKRAGLDPDKPWLNPGQADIF